jgi:DNA polymerase-1
VPRPAPLLIADTPWLLYRSFFALPASIRGSDGRPVNALLGTVNALLSAIEACRPRAVAACMGAEDAAYRVKLYPGYHAHRDPMPTELAGQWEMAPGLLEGLGWTVTTTVELEADDVMFSYARTEAEAGGRALLLTADRDLYAAVDEGVAIIEVSRTGRASEIGPAQVRERYGIEPELVPDFIALRGDPSDGLPGAPGIGAKTAAALLRRYGSLEGALRAASSPIGAGEASASEQGAPGNWSPQDEMRPRTAATLNGNAQLLRTFREIATLQRIEVGRPPDEAGAHAAGAALARELGMRALAERLERMTAATGRT